MKKHVSKARSRILIIGLGIAATGAVGFFGWTYLRKRKQVQSQDTRSNTAADASAPGPAKKAAPVAAAVGKALTQAVIKKDFKAVLANLKKLKSKNDYSKTSENFKKQRIGGVRKTLVNGVLSSFKDEKQKQQIRQEFTRMGLNYDGEKWSLSGIDARALITTEPTVVWVDKQTPVQTPANVILGREISRKAGFVLFENPGGNFLVRASTVNYA